MAKLSQLLKSYPQALKSVFCDFSGMYISYPQFNCFKYSSLSSFIVNGFANFK